MGAEDAQQRVLLQKFIHGLHTKLIGAVSILVGIEVTLFSLLVFNRICPHEVAQ